MKENANNFLKNLFTQLEDQKIDVKNWEVDHLCYRTSTEDNYQATKQKFDLLGTCLIESEVNGRLIATYKLKEPIHYNDRIIDLVEVPAPKPNKKTPEGFEHIEIVIDESFDFFMNKYPRLSFNKKGLEKELNPELEVEFKNCAVKFHHKSLEHIINIEKNNTLIEFLNESKILTKLKEFSPCLSGTIPLDINTIESDVDILLEGTSAVYFIKTVQKHFSDWNGFSIRETEHQGLPTVVVNFSFHSLPIELFFQNKSVFKQQANQHFLIEGRLIKILGPEFKQKIKKLKSEGVKTEPAFGQVLNLKEPYRELIELNLKSDKEILNLYS